MTHFFREQWRKTQWFCKLSTEALPSAVVTVVASHCCGNKSLPWFPSKLWFCFKCTDTVEWMLWVEKRRQPASGDHRQVTQVERLWCWSGTRGFIQTCLYYRALSNHTCLVQRNKDTSHNWPVNTDALSDQTAINVHIHRASDTVPPSHQWALVWK